MLLNLLKFESKNQQFAIENKLDNTPLVIQASIIGSEIIIKNLTQAKWLYKNGNYGNFVGNRMDFVNSKCFLNNFDDESINNVTQESKSDYNDSDINLLKVKNEDEISLNLINEKIEKTWLISKRSSNYLFLSLIEALYLLELESTKNRFDFCNKINDISIVKFQIDNFHSFEEFYLFICQTVLSKNELKNFLKRFFYCNFLNLNLKI